MKYKIVLQKLIWRKYVSWRAELRKTIVESLLIRRSDRDEQVQIFCVSWLSVKTHSNAAYDEVPNLGVVECHQ